MICRSVHIPLLAAIASVAALAPGAAAQRGSFEGVVTYRAEGEGPIDYYVRDGVLRVEVPFGGQKRAMILNPGARTMVVLVPEQQSYMQMSIPADEPGDAAADDVKITKLGKTDVIAGHPCEYVRLEEPGGQTAEVCAATDMGSFVAMAGGGGRRGRGNGGGAWQRRLGQDLFPLKVVSQESGKGAVVLEATKIERKKLDPALFEPPSSFRKIEMPMMRPPGGA